MATKSTKKVARKAKTKSVTKPKAKAAGAAGAPETSGPINPSGSGNT
jgi:hypothetical protein